MSARPVKPWFRKDRGQWYTTYQGRQIPLAKGKANRAEAERAFAALIYGQGSKPTVVGDLTSLADLLARWVEWSSNINSSDTTTRYRLVGQAFVAWAGPDTPADSMREADIVRWARSHGWTTSTQVSNVSAVRGMYAFGVRNRLLTHNPADQVKIGRSMSRRQIMTAQQTDTLFEYMREHATQELLDLCTFLYHVGCRPSEAYRVESKHVDTRDWIVALPLSKTGRATGKIRRIYMPEGPARELATRLMRRWKVGALLRNHSGRPWIARRASAALAELRPKLGFGPECTLESFRHQWITDALERGLSVATVAEIAGTSIQMIARYYSKLGDRTTHLSEAAGRVRTEPGRSELGLDSVQPDTPSA